jgi:RNAse (barnase) inhibitor barstar
MSGLAALLAVRTAPGIYRWHANFEVQDVRHSVELAGWRFAHYSGWVHEDKAAVLEGLGVALSFPDHYGRNLDALADCLKDLVAPGRGTLLLWDGWAPFARADRRAFDATLDALRTRVQRERGGSFAVLLRGDGPETADLPSLD